jgi:VIT1/CCC1 family predicted Fe2+/Mn2+ transporter
MGNPALVIRLLLYSHNAYSTFKEEIMEFLMNRIQMFMGIYSSFNDFTGNLNHILTSKLLGISKQRI